MKTSQPHRFERSDNGGHPMYRILTLLCVCLSACTFSTATDNALSYYYAVNCEKAVLEVPARREALSFCTRALERRELTREDIAGAYSNRGVLRANLGEFEEALRDQERAYRKDKHNGLICMNLANAYLRIGDYERALMFYDRAAKLRPDFKLVYENRSLAHAALGQQSDAAHDLSLAASRHGAQ